MSLARSSGRAEVDWLEMAHQVSVTLMEAYEQLITTQGSSISAPEDNDLNTLTKMREIAIGQLKTVLESFSVPDLVDIPAETRITNIVLADKLLRELKELGLIKENLSSNIGNLEDLVKNRTARDKNLLEIIQGLKKETEAIEEDDDEEEFKQLRRMTKKIRDVLDFILDEAYPELKDDVKNIIQVLYEAKDKEDPYVQVPENVDVQAITLLISAKIITQHEDDPNFIRLMIY